MTRDEARLLVGTLAANWPSVRLGNANVALRVQQLEPYAYDVGEEAVRRVIDEAVYWPPWSTILDAIDRVRYERAQHMATARGLEEPPVSAAQRAENRRQAAAMLDRLSGTLAWENDAA